jgi:hypothetical protein
VLSIAFAWFLGRRAAGPQAILMAQLGNLLIWPIFGTIIHLRFGIRVTSEGSLFLTPAVASTMLSLIATLVSSGAFRSRLIKS